MKKNITLNFEKDQYFKHVKSTGNLFGNEFGQKVFRELVLPEVDLEEESVLIVEIPEYVTYVGPSFFQGIVIGFSKAFPEKDILSKLKFYSKNKSIEIDANYYINSEVRLND